MAVLGGGSWATALVKILTENAVKVHWWLRNEQAAKHLRKYHHNPNYLSNVSINRRKVKIYTQLPKALASAQFVVVAIPAAFVPEALAKVQAADLEGKVMVSAVKGLIPQSQALITEHLTQYLQVPAEQTAVIAGPCHAEEVALEKQSFLTIASNSATTATSFANLLNCRYIQTTTSQDVLGIEYCAVMKNIIALTCGIAHGLNYGDNFQAVLVSNALQEMSRLVAALDPQPRDLSASAYLGDLLVTAYSQFSRNRTFGNMIGRGYSVKSAQVEMNMVAEGYYAVQSIYQLNQKLQVNMPITTAAYQILYENARPAPTIQQLIRNLV